VGAFEAKKLGASMAAINIGQHIAHHAMAKPKNWQPLLYCWRGGKRSGSLALVLDQIGFQVTLLEGGYKAFRAALVQDTEALAKQFDFRVICGTTGCGKTRLLHALKQQGAQTLDLEGLARHRSSVLGLVPGTVQPSQKAFDTAIWHALSQLDPGQPVYIESESKKVGNVAVPVALMDKVRAATCITIDLPMPHRIQLLMQDYPHFVADPEFFSQRLDALIQLRGKQQIAHWQERLAQGAIEEVVGELLTLHYDPIYLASIERNFTQSKQGGRFALADASAGELSSVTERILGLRSITP
jgi:tRNA 2-selenouridine synthase